MRRYYRGQVYYANLNPVVGSEQGGDRPVLILQNNTGNRYANTVIVAAISSKRDAKHRQPTHCPIRQFGVLEHHPSSFWSSFVPLIKAGCGDMSGVCPDRI